MLNTTAARIDLRQDRADEVIEWAARLLDAQTMLSQ
jgi:hypothetical protein